MIISTYFFAFLNSITTSDMNNLPPRLSSATCRVVIITVERIFVDNLCFTKEPGSRIWSNEVRNLKTLFCLHIYYDKQQPVSRNKWTYFQTPNGVIDSSVSICKHLMHKERDRINTAKNNNGEATKTIDLGVYTVIKGKT